MDNYEQLLVLLPATWRAYVVLAFQLSTAFVAALTVLVPVLEKLAALTTSKTDDEALTRVKRLLSLFPRVQVPAISQRPPAPAQELAEVVVLKRPDGSPILPTAADLSKK